MTIKFREIPFTPKPKRGRPPTGFDKKAYMKEYMRKRRALLHPKPILAKPTTTK